MTHPTSPAGMTSPAPAGDWLADPAACTITFAVRNFGLRTVTGQIPLTSAVVHIGPDGEPAGLRAELDAGGIRTGHPRRDNDLRGRRFLRHRPVAGHHLRGRLDQAGANRLGGERNPHRQGHRVPGAARCRSLARPGR